MKCVHQWDDPARIFRCILRRVKKKLFFTLCLADSRHPHLIQEGGVGSDRFHPDGYGEGQAHHPDCPPGGGALPEQTAQEDHGHARSDETPELLDVGEYPLEKNMQASVTISNPNTDGFIIADGVGFIKIFQ